MKTILSNLNSIIEVSPVEYECGSPKVWRIPNFGLEDDHHFQTNKRMNKFLKHQFERTEKAVKDRNWPLLFRIYWALLLRSKSFKIYWFNKIIKGWYFNREKKDILRILDRMNRNMRKSSGTLISKRTYIPKSDGRKRPLGVPRPEWRVITGALAECLTRSIGPSLSLCQHGFLPNRSALTAWTQILKKFDQLKNKDIYVFEFDLESCFNKISIDKINDLLIEYGIPEEYVRYIYRVNSSFPINKIKNLDLEDKEVYNLQTRGPIKDMYSVRKDGLPQGLPWSPILTILALDRLWKKTNVEPIMFADDGLLIGTKESAFEMVLALSSKAAEQFGVFPSYKIKDGIEQTRLVEDDKFTFLGLTYNIEEKSFQTPSGLITPKTLGDLRNLVLDSYNQTEYSRTENWEWNIKAGSVLDTIREKKSLANLENAIKFITNEIKGTKHPIIEWEGKYFDYQKESSRCCCWIAEEVIFKNSKQIPIKEMYGSDILSKQSDIVYRYHALNTQNFSLADKEKYLPTKEVQYIEWNKRNHLMRNFYDTEYYSIKPRKFY